MVNLTESPSSWKLFKRRAKYRNREISRLLVPSGSSELTLPQLTFFPIYELGVRLTLTRMRRSRRREIPREPFAAELTLLIHSSI